MLQWLFSKGMLSWAASPWKWGVLLDQKIHQVSIDIFALLIPIGADGFRLFFGLDSNGQVY